MALFRRVPNLNNLNILNVRMTNLQTIRNVSRMQTIHSSQQVQTNSQKSLSCCRISKQSTPFTVTAPQRTSNYFPSSHATKQTLLVLPRRSYGTTRVLYTEQNTGVELGRLDRKYQIHYTCCVCETRSIKTISQQAYKEGVVLVQCDGCEKYHLIADNLGWFSDTRVNIEDIIAEKGGNVVKVTNSHELEFVPKIKEVEEVEEE